MKNYWQNDCRSSSVAPKAYILREIGEVGRVNWSYLVEDSEYSPGFGRIFLSTKKLCT